MERESEEKISYNHAIEIAASSQNSLAGGSRGKCQTVARVNLGPEVAAILLRIVEEKKFLEMRCCLRKCFEKIFFKTTSGAHYFWQLSALADTTANQWVPRASERAHLKCHH